jgi:hypothetical protein
MLHYSGTEYQDDVPTFKFQGLDPKTQWLETKLTLGLDFPNLPYYIDGNYCLYDLNLVFRSPIESSLCLLKFACFEFPAQLGVEWTAVK